MAARSRSKAGRSNRSPRRTTRTGAAVPPPPSASQHDALAARLTQERMEALVAALHPKEGVSQDKAVGQGIRAVHKNVRESYDLLNSLLDDLILDPPLACKRGCIHCCYNQIALTESEAVYLGLYLLESRDRKQLLTLEAKTRALVEDLKGKSWQDIGMNRHRLPCLFLEDGHCSVYPARPLACRGWNSVDASMCLQSNLSEDAMTPIENHSLIRLMADAIQSGLLRGSKGLGLEAGYLLMSRAVYLLLDGGAEQGVLRCASDWLRGQPFFARKRDW